MKKILLLVGCLAVAGAVGLFLHNSVPQLDAEGKLQGKITLAKLMKLPEKTHGPLRECGYSSSGDMNGNTYRVALAAAENGEMVLTIEESPAFWEPLEVRKYRADDDALEQMAAIVARYHLMCWDVLPQDTEMIALDAPSTGVWMTWDDSALGGFAWESVRISYDAKKPSEGWEILREFTSCLFQWETDERLLERYQVTEEEEQAAGGMQGFQPIIGFPS